MVIGFGIGIRLGISGRVISSARRASVEGRRVQMGVCIENETNKTVIRMCSLYIVNHMLLLHMVNHYRSAYLTS